MVMKLLQKTSEPKENNFLFRSQHISLVKFFEQVLNQMLTINKLASKLVYHLLLTELTVWKCFLIGVKLTLPKNLF